MIRLSNREDIEELLYGCLYYGGGGGGSFREGLDLALKVLRIKGYIDISDIDEVRNEDILATVSAVGVQSKSSTFEMNYIVDAIRLLESQSVSLYGLIPSEVGAFNTVVPWVGYALYNLTLVDAPCDGRAHPTTLMGSMGLHKREGYTSRYAIVGGDKARGTYLKVYTEGRLHVNSRLARLASIYAGGMVITVRNPIEARYAREHGAPGSIKKALEIGRIIRKYLNVDLAEACYKAIEKSNGVVIDECILDKVMLDSREGFDAGYIKLHSSSDEYKVFYLNEYMALDSNSRGRLATFPDLIVLFNLKTGLPVLSSEASKFLNGKILIAVVNRSNLILGDGVKYPEAYEVVEEILGIKLTPYIRDILIN